MSDPNPIGAGWEGVGAKGTDTIEDRGPLSQMGVGKIAGVHSKGGQSTASSPYYRVCYNPTDVSLSFYGRLQVLIGPE